MKKMTFLFIGSFLILAGCTTTVRDSLGYAPVIEHREKNHITLTIEEFEDTRVEGQQIGKVKNLYGIPIIKITTGENIPNWVRNALKMELTNAGYSIVDACTLDGYSIQGKINKVFAKSHFSFDVCVAIEISLKKGEKIIFQKVYEAHHNGKVNCTNEKGEWIEYATLAEAFKYDLQEICKSFTVDINQCLLESSTTQPLKNGSSIL